MGEHNYEDINLMNYEGIRKFKSVRRAIKRGHITSLGIIPPKKPFNNRSRKKGSRPLEEEKEVIYGRVKKKY